MKQKYLKGLVVENEINEKDGTLSVAVATDSSVDRDGEIVDANGLNFDNFLKNPVLLYAHDYRSDPIGKVISIKRDGSRVLFTPQFAIDISDRAKQYFELCKGGFLNAFSIGFIPKEWTDKQNPDGSYNRIFTKSELLEISLVPVPANPNALVLARGYKNMKFDEEILSDMEKNKDGEVVAVVEEEKQKEYVEKSEFAGLSDTVNSLKEKVEGIEKSLADNGDKETKAITVDELIKHPDFQTSVLKAIDKSIGVSLRDINRSKNGK